MTSSYRISPLDFNLPFGELLTLPTAGNLGIRHLARLVNAALEGAPVRSGPFT